MHYADITMPVNSDKGAKTVVKGHLQTLISVMRVKDGTLRQKGRGGN